MAIRFWVVCYDIADPKRLRRVAKEMEASGDRVQKSVFECGLSAGELNALRVRLKSRIDVNEDKLLYMPICPECRARVHWLGRYPPAAAEPFWIV